MRPTKQPPSLKHIAAAAGVDRSTVSLALRNDERISVATRERIHALANVMGYRQNPVVAQLMSQLRAGQQNHFFGNLAIVDLTPAGEQSTPNQIWAGIRARCDVLGYGLEVFRAVDFTAARLEQIMVHRGIRGLVLASLWKRTQMPENYHALCQRFACCVLGIHVDDPQLYYVSTDHHMCTLLAVKKLAARGFERIGMAMHAGVNVESEGRFIGGYHAGLGVFPQLHQVPVHLCQPGAESEFMDWFQKHRPEAIICIQREIMGWLKNAGYRVPEDVSLVHLETEAPEVDDWAGICQRRFDRGRSAVDAVVAQINMNEKGAPSCPRGTIVEPEWKDGSTLGKPPGLITGGGHLKGGQSSVRKGRAGKPSLL